MSENDSRYLDDARIMLGTLFQPCPVSMHTKERVSNVQLLGVELDSRF